MKGFTLWIYLSTCFICANTLFTMLNATVPNEAKPTRRNSKMSKDFPYPYLPEKSFTQPVKQLRKQQLTTDESDEINEIPDELDPKIVGGREAVEGQFPWMAALYYQGEFVCSSFLVTTTILMTAAHCVVYNNETQPAELFHAIIGNNNRSAPETRLEFTELAVNPDYYKGNLDGDIAVFRTRGVVQTSNRIQTICLPAAGRKFEDKPVQAMGWGVTSNRERINPEILRFTDLKVQPLKQCQLIFLLMGITITERHVCAVSYRATGVCFGDSGGPLVYTDNGIPLAIGIASFVTRLGCGRPLLPSVYTATSAYTEWITVTIGGNELCFV